MRANTGNISTIDVTALPKTARRELYDFYTFLKTKYGEKDVINNKKLTQATTRFTTFLSIPIKSKEFVMLDRDERNER